MSWVSLKLSCLKLQPDCKDTYIQVVGNLGTLINWYGLGETTCSEFLLLGLASNSLVCSYTKVKFCAIDSQFVEFNTNWGKFTGYCNLTCVCVNGHWISYYNKV